MDIKLPFSSFIFFREVPPILIRSTGQSRAEKKQQIAFIKNVCIQVQ
jgi:hypothetical protein